MPELVCGFTGYRTEKLPYPESDPRFYALYQRIRETVYALCGQGYTRFISGFAQGCDQLFALAVIRAKENYPHIILEAAIPFAGQADRWERSKRLRYSRLLALCDVRTCISKQYFQGCYHKRNRYIVQHSDCMLAVYDGQTGGTAWTLAYARAQGVPVRQILP